jgi:hypothetical protein
LRQRQKSKTKASKDWWQMKRINLIAGEKIEEIVALRPLIHSLLNRPAEKSAAITVTLPPGREDLAPFLPEGIVLRYSSEIELGQTNIRCSEKKVNLIDGEDADWLTVFDGSLQAGPCNPYHRIDLLRKIAGLDSEDTEFSLPTFSDTDDELPAQLFVGAGPKIGICLSSLDVEDAKAAIAEVFRSKPGCEVFLLGTLTDKRKSQLLLEIEEKNADRMFDLCGRMSPRALARVLQLCDLAILGAGASALLASGYGTFCVCIQRQELNLDLPYGHGHIILRPEDQWNPEIFANLLGEILSFVFQSQSPPDDNAWIDFAEARLHNYLGRIRLFQQQRIELRFSGGSFTLEMYQKPLIYFGANYLDAVRCLHRLMWEKTIADRTITTQELSILHDETIPLLSHELSNLKNLCELASFGLQYSLQVGRALERGDIAQAKIQSEKLQEVEDLLHSIGAKSVLCLPMTTFHQTRQAMLPNTMPLQLALEMQDQFSNLKLRGIIVLDLVQNLFRSTVGKGQEPEISSEGGASIDA